MRPIVPSAVLLLFSLPCLAQVIPSTQTKALDGSAVVLPQAGSQKPLLLMIGFSHKSSGDFDQWNKQVLSSYLSNPAVAYYEMTDLQGVPSFVKAMILHGMRREIHGEERSHFVPFYNSEKEWQTLVSYSKPEHAYLVLADNTGHVIWQAQGAPDAEKIATLKAKLSSMAPSATN